MLGSSNPDQRNREKLREAIWETGRSLHGEESFIVIAEPFERVITEQKSNERSANRSRRLTEESQRSDKLPKRSDKDPIRQPKELKTIKILPVTKNIWHGQSQQRGREKEQTYGEGAWRSQAGNRKIHQTNRRYAQKPRFQITVLQDEARTGR